MKLRSVRLRPYINQEWLLSMFLGGKPGYDSAFFQDGYTYATDGACIARARLDNEPAFCGEGNFPNAADLFKKIFRPRRPELLLLPLIGELSGIGETCPVCDNYRVSLDSLPVCDDVEAELDARGYDPDEWTVLDKDCPHCKGRKYTGPWTYPINGIDIAYEYLKRLNELQPVFVSESAEAGCGAILFQGAFNIDGMVMGVVEPRQVST